MYKYHSAGISHTFFHSLAHTQTPMHVHTQRRSERQIYEALVTVAALPMAALQMRAKARAGGLNFLAQTMHVKEAHQRHSLKTGRCCSEHKEQTTGPCQRAVEIEMCISRSCHC